jgi:hypothetical protein
MHRYERPSRNVPMFVEKSRGRQGDYAAVVADKAQITFGRSSPGASPSKFRGHSTNKSPNELPKSKSSYIVLHSFFLHYLLNLT